MNCGISRDVSIAEDGGDSAVAVKSDVSDLCRLCANTDNQLIPIFKGEGLEHDIPVKLKKHLPIIEVTECDELPLQVCYQCASTLLAWHNLYEGCSAADERLRKILKLDQKDEVGMDYTDDFQDDNYEPDKCADVASSLHQSVSVAECDTVFDSKNIQDDGTATRESVCDTDSANVNFDRYLQQEFNSVNNFYECMDTNAFFKTQTSTEHMTFNNSDVLDEFLVRHVNGLNPGEFGADVCSCVWSNNDCSKCAQFQNFQCHFCLMLFSEVRVRNRHIRVSHRPELLKYCMDWFLTRAQCGGIFPDSHERIQSICPETSLAADDHLNLTDHLCNENYAKTALKRSKPISEKLPTAEYHCEHCSVVVSTKTSMKKHLLTSHPTTQSYPALVEEQKNPSDSCTSGYSCDTCGQIFLKKHSFTRHLNSHSSVHFDCNQCKKTFTSEKAFRTHQDRQHHGLPKNIFLSNRKKYLKCGQCPFTCCNERNKLEEHMRIHTGEKPFTCEECGKQFRTKALFRVHKRFVHEGVKKYACDICGRCFSNKRYVEEHRRIHTGEKPLICDLCGKTFRQTASLSKHVENHLGIKRYACNLCDKRFANSYHLSRHIKRHLGETNFNCDLCGKKFIDQHALKIHNVVHSDVRPFSCIKCGATFKLRKHLKQHEKIHNTCDDF